jgi:PTS system ascorbate-specific IIB component
VLITLSFFDSAGRPCSAEFEYKKRREFNMGEIRIQAVCGFGCGSSLFLRMRIEEILKKNGYEATVFCGDVGTCISAKCDAIFISEDLAERIVGRAAVPVVVIDNFMNKAEVEEKTLAFMKSLE